ncbi:MAG: hypothetical protein QE285_12640 [Aquabacterium sp.]|nr:hypothetical protein [Aquabacterium sp.]
MPPSTTVVESVWVLLALFASLSAVTVAVALITDGPATTARQVSTMVRTSLPSAPTVPRLHRTVVLLLATQLALAGLTDTRAAPPGTLKFRRVLVAASTALLSTRTV